MAWSAATGLAGANSKVSGTTLAMNPSAAVPVDAILIVGCASDNTITTSGDTDTHTVTDSVGNTYTKLGGHTHSPGGVAADGSTVTLWITQVTVALATTDTITLTLSAAATAKAIGAAYFTIGAGMTWQQAGTTQTGHAANSTTSSSLALSGLPSAEHLFVSAAGVEAPTTFTYTNDTDFTTLLSRGTSGSTASGNIWMRMLKDVATATGVTQQDTISTASDWASILVAIDEVSAAGPQTITVSAIASTASLAAPTGVDASGHATILADNIAATTALHSPAPVAASGHASILADNITSTAALHAPDVSGSGSVTISAPSIASTLTIHAPTSVDPGPLTLDVSIIASTAVIHAANADAAGYAPISVPPLSGGATIHGPTLAAAGHATITAPEIASTTGLHAPTFAASGAVTIDAPAIATTATLHAPTSLANVVGSLELDDEFETGIDAAYTNVGAVTLEASAPINGSKSLRYSGTGAKYLRHAAPAGKTVEVFRIKYRHDAHPTGASATIYNSDTAAGKSGQLRVTTLGVLQGLVNGGTAINGPTLVVGQSYIIKGRYDVSGTTFTLDWMVDGVAQTQATFANGAASVSTYSRPGQSNAAPTYNYVIDSWAISRVSGDHPLPDPTALPYTLTVSAIASTTALHATGPTFPGLGVRVSAIASTAALHAPLVSQIVPPAAPYTGPRGVMIRTVHQDITADYATSPWADIVACWIKYKDLKPTSGAAYDWGGVITSLRHCIDNPGRRTAIRVSLGIDFPSWGYSANPIAQVANIRVYDDSTDTTGHLIPIPWDAGLRTHWQAILTSLYTLLETSYNGAQYKDVVAFVGVSMAMNIGTEMTIGDAGDPRNTANWNATGTQTQRRARYTQAWKDSLYDNVTILTNARPFIATGTAWADRRQIVKDVADYAAANWPDQLGDILFGPTDMRVDKPGAVSYAAWTQSASDAIDYVRALGITTWAQSAGNSWWGSAPTGTFDIPTADAVKKAWLDQSTTLYRNVVMECQPDVISRWSLASWCQSTLAPAVKALALPQTIRAGHIASSAQLHAPPAPRGINPPYLRAPVIGPTAVVRGGSLDLSVPHAPQYLVPCYTQSTSVSTFVGHEIVQIVNPVFEVDVE